MSDRACCPTCGSREYGPGWRVEATRTLGVLWCPSCGFETPPAHGCRCGERTDVRERIVGERECAGCGVVFALTLDGQRRSRRFCGTICAGRYARAQQQAQRRST